MANYREIGSSDITLFYRRSLVFFQLYSYQGAPSCHIILFHWASVISILLYCYYTTLFHGISPTSCMSYYYREVPFISHGFFIHLRIQLLLPIGTVGIDLLALCLKEESNCVMKNHKTKKNRNYKKRKGKEIMDEKSKIFEKRKKYKKKDEAITTCWNFTYLVHFLCRS